MSDPQITLPFSLAPDESVDPRVAPPGTVLAASNQIYDSEGQYQTRYGYTSLATMSSVVRLATFANDLVAFGASSGVPFLWVYDPQSASMRPTDTLSPVVATHTPLVNASTTFMSCGETVASGYRIVAWVDAVDLCVHASVFSVATGAMLATANVTGLAMVAYSNLFIGVVGGTVILTAAVYGAPYIYGYTLNLSTLTWSTATLLSTGAYTTNYGTYAAAFTAAGLAIVFMSASAQYTTLLYSAALSLTASSTSSLTAGTTGAVAIAAAGTSSQLCVAFLFSSTGYASHVVVAWNALPSCTFERADALATVSFSGTAQEYAASVTILPNGNGLVLASDGQTVWRQQFSSSTGVVSSTYIATYNAALASAPVYVSSASTALVMFREVAGLSGVQGSYFLVDLFLASGSPQRFLRAVLAPTIVNPPTVSGSSGVTQRNVPAWSAPTSTTFETTLPISRASAGRQGLDLFTIDVASSSLYATAQLGPELYANGCYYDRNIINEIGFAQTPYATVTDTGTGYTRQYCFTWAYIDAAGNLEESAPSTPITVTGGATPSATISARTICLTNKQRVAGWTTSIFLLVYRTQSLASGDSTFYRVSTEPFQTMNQLTAATISASDTISDGTLATHPVLYTVSGELAHNAPETMLHVVSHVDRIWGIGADQQTIWYSQVYSDGFVPAWSDIAQVRVSDNIEPLVALASMYDRLLVFTRARIYTIFGQGPSDAGTGNDLTEPQRVPSPVGCIEPRSVVSTPLGIMFQSSRGLEVIGQDMQVQFIGMPVSTTTATYPICTSAVLCPTTSTVRFTMTTSEAIPNSGTGAVLVYDLRRNRWAVHKITCGGSRGTLAGAPMQAAVWSPAYGYVAAHNDSVSGGYVYRECNASDATPWLDFGSYFIPLSVTTAWIKSGDLEGWQRMRRIRVLANYYDSHGLTVTLDYDYQTVGESHAMTSAQIASLVSGSWEQVRIIPGRGKSQAIRVTLSTAAPTAPQTNGSGRGAGFVGLAFEVRAKPGGYRNLGAGAKS